MTFLDELGLSIVATESIIPPSGGAAGLVDDRVANKVSSYSHELTANGGFFKCDFEIKANLDELLSWLFGGIGRDITVTDSSGQVIWNGFVDRLELQLASLTIGIGPLLDISNQVQVVYQTRTYDTIPPVGGAKGRTGFAEDTNSVNQYGKFMRVVNGGEGTFPEMEALRDTYIADNAYPKTSRAINSSGTNEPALKISCLGYFHMLKRSIYFELDNFGAVGPSVVILDVLGDEPNGLFTNTFDVIDNSTITIGQFKNDNDASLNVIKDAVARGDVIGRRYTFGIYEDRRVEYQPAQQDLITYFYSIATNTYIDTAGGVVKPWNVVPSRWVRVLDAPTPGNLTLQQDPGSIFIESIKFSAPYGLSIAGGTVDSISQKVAQQGLGGSF